MKFLKDNLRKQFFAGTYGYQTAYGFFSEVGFLRIVNKH